MESMSAARLLIALYLDENMSLEIARVLTKRGYDVVTAHAAGMLTEPDHKQLEYAVSQERTLVTENRDDFLTLHETYVIEGKTHYGIVIAKARQQMEIVTRLEKILDQFLADEMEMRILFI